MRQQLVLVLWLASLPDCGAVTNLSTWASSGPSGRVLRYPDALGNRVLDYSGVGYRGGAVPLPQVPVKVSIGPVSGDNGAHIQAAIDQVKALPLDANGFRGAVLLLAGEYPVAGSITINASGIVLRGVGDDPAGTILRATGTNQRTLIRITGSGSASTVSGTTHNITNNYVPVGARSFNVNSTSGLAAGDRVFVRRIATDLWIHDLGMDLLCCPPDVNPWTPSGYNIDSDRFITRIEGNRIMIDAPLTCAIDQYYGGGTIRKITWSGRINNVGIEDVRGVSDYVSSTDENHGWTFLQFSAVENAWARRVTSQYFGYSCVSLSGWCRSITVQDCRSLNPISQITGGRRYAFVLDDSQLCLVQNCYTLQDRHQFVTQSLTTGPNVFVDGLSDTAYSDAGPHHRWGTGALWDNVQVNGNNLDVQNRGNSGSGHGWAGANEVVWNCRASAFIVQNPPTARNWLIGSIGPIKNGTMYVGPHDPGTYDSHGTNVYPNSLYYAQLQDRLAAPKLETREYAVGEINGFAVSRSTGTVVPVDPAWAAAIQTAAAGASVNGFDLVTNSQWVPFTFSFTLGATDRVVAATLTLAVRAYDTNGANEALYLDNTANALSFVSLGWQPVATGTNTSVFLLDLGTQLGLLADGRLNVAVRDNVGVDWATLELQVAPVQTLFTNSLLPVADAFVRGGIYTGVNYGTNTTLDLKADTVADNQRQAYLHWNLAGFSPQVQHARIRLAPLSVGTNGLENGIALATSSDWNEHSLNWNNQPGTGKRFATWIPAVQVPVECAVTPQVQAALAGDGQLSLELFSLKNVGGPGFVSYASKEDPEINLRPQLLLVYSNTLPVISPVSDQVLSANTNTGAIPFTVGDAGYPVNLLSVGAVSSDPVLVPPGNISLGGSLSNRTVTVTPAWNQTGTGTVTIIVTNPAGMTAGSSFTLAVTNGLIIPNVPSSGTWAVDASGNWNDPANWSGGRIATGASMTATLSLDITASRYLNNDSPRPLGGLAFGDANPGSLGTWMITNQPVTLQVSNGTPSISVSNVTASIECALAGTQGLVSKGDGTLVLAGPNSFSGTTTISSGALRLAHDQALGSISSGTTIGNDPTARLELIGGISLAEPITVSCKGSANGNVPAILNVSATNTLAGPITLTTGGSYWTFEAAGGKLFVTGSPTNTTTTNVRTIWLRGGAEGDWQSPIGDSAGGFATTIRKDDPGLWSLSGDNHYSGNTVISNGILRIQGAVRGAAVSVYGGVLGGGGLVAAPVAVYSGGTLAPANLAGALTISNNLTLAAGSTSAFQINAQTLACDHVRGLTSVAYGGTLFLTNIAGSIVAGQTFQLFSAAGASGTFSGIVPPYPGPALAWNWNPVNGTVSVVPLPPPQFTSSALGPDGALTLSGTGPTGQPYRLVVTTNLGLPLANWTSISTGLFSGGVFTFTDLQASNHTQRYYRISLP